MKEFIIVICDREYDAKKLFQDSLKTLRVHPSNIDKKHRIFETDIHKFKFVSKYDISSGRTDGLKPDQILTSYEFAMLIFGAYK